MELESFHASDHPVTSVSLIGLTFWDASRAAVVGKEIAATDATTVVIADAIFQVCIQSSLDLNVLEANADNFVSTGNQ